MRPSLTRLALAAALAAACACGPTGPDTHSGRSACDQLRECLCDGDRGIDPTLCNQAVDAFEQGTDPARTCSLQLQFQGCGRPLQVNPAGF